MNRAETFRGGRTSERQPDGMRQLPWETAVRTGQGYSWRPAAPRGMAGGSTVLARGRGLGNSKGKGPVVGKNSISSGTSNEASATEAGDHGGVGGTPRVQA